MTYIIPAFIVGICGAMAGILLTAAAKIFYVETDERIEKIGESLPQANCGACGYAGCADYAAAVVNNGVPVNLCRPGGGDTAASIAAILGTSAEDVVPMTAIVRCNGDCDATQTAFSFDGVQSCTAVKRFYGGNGLCRYGCIGLGDCVNVCDSNAIKLKNGIAKVIPSLCKACGQCVSVCPNQLISIRPLAKHIDVLCSSAANGKETKLSCKNGCLGCKLCERKCPEGAVKIENFHATIDYDKCTACGTCIDVCPVKAIHSCKK